MYYKIQISYNTAAAAAAAAAKSLQSCPTLCDPVDCILYTIYMITPRKTYMENFNKVRYFIIIF